MAATHTKEMPVTRATRATRTTAAMSVSRPARAPRRWQLALGAGAVAWLLAGGAPLVSPLVALPIAQQTDVESWATRLVDSPALAAGDLDAAVNEWLALLAAEPGHPLAEATLRLVGMMQDRTADPAAVAQALLALPAQGLSPLAARQLDVLVGLARATREPVSDPPAELHPDYLGHAFVLGPLPPLGHPLAARDPSPQYVEPGFGAVHPGVDGDELRWQSLRRYPLTRALEPAEAIEPARGWALLAFVFDVPAGGPAWIEIGQRRGGSIVPPYALSVNGDAALVVEHLHEESAPVERHPALLRAGRNRLVLKCALDSRPEFAVRVLDAQGRPWGGLSAVTDLARAEEPLGTPPATRALAGDPPLDSIAFLSKLRERGPDSEALLGLLLCQEGRESEGLAHVRAACEAAPERTGLAALRARLTLEAAYLPASWKKNTARVLAEGVVQSEPHRFDMALHLAGVLADEDREEEAVAALIALGEALPHQAQSRLALADVYRKLNMDVAAERALLAAQAVAPASPGVLRALAQHASRIGQATRSIELALTAVRAAGVTGPALRQIAGRFAALGLLDRAEPLYREAVLRDDDRGARSDLGQFLAEARRWDEADALFAELAARYPGWDRPCLQRADVARLRGDGAAELAHLREAQARAPSSRVTRERLATLTGEDPVEDFFTANLLDLDALRAGFDATGSKDSVVKLLDHAVVMLFPDGGFETVTQDLYLARDLAACETLGELQPQGEVLRIATIKADGTEYEPVGTGNYVMPNLKPGDFVVHVTRSVERPPEDGVLHVGTWSFASLDEPFVQSSYVISVPQSVTLKLVERQFTGEHTTVEHTVADGADGVEAVVHRFVMRQQPRVLPEPQAPPARWFLPWIAFGTDAEVPTIMANLAAGVLPPTKVTPEIRQAAAQATAGLSGDTAKARALHAFVNDTLDQRGWQDATQALLQREGNASFLYAALLEAAGVPHELVWSRNVAPDADEEPDPPFIEPGYWSRNLLVFVQPRDGEAAWCDMNAKTMPYGHLVGDAPGAPAVAVPSCRLLTLPTLPPAERPGAALDIELVLAADGSAQAQGELRWTAGLGYAIKEQVREYPDAKRKSWMTSLAAWLLPGIDMSDYAMPGLDSPDEPLMLRVNGTVPAFLDDDGTALVCRLPFPPLGLKGQLAGGEGLRKLPYFLSEPQVQSATVRLELPPELQALGLPEGYVAELHGGRYELSVTRPEPDTLLVRRAIALPPFALPPEQYAEFEAFCSKVDEVERGQLRFTRVAVPAGT